MPLQSLTRIRLRAQVKPSWPFDYMKIENSILIYKKNRTFPPYTGLYHFKQLFWYRFIISQISTSLFSFVQHLFGFSREFFKFFFAGFSENFVIDVDFADDLLKFLSKFLKLFTEFSCSEAYFWSHSLQSQLFHFCIDLPDFHADFVHSHVPIKYSTGWLVRPNVLILHQKCFGVILKEVISSFFLILIC